MLRQSRCWPANRVFAATLEDCLFVQQSARAFDAGVFHNLHFNSQLLTLDAQEMETTSLSQCFDSQLVLGLIRKWEHDIKQQSDSAGLVFVAGLKHEKRNRSGMSLTL